MKPTETRRVVIDTTKAAWKPADPNGPIRLPLHLAPDTGESVTLERMSPGTHLSETEQPGGEEIFVLSGDAVGPVRIVRRGNLDQEPGRLPQRIWLGTAERPIGRSEDICARCHDRTTMATTTAPKQRSETAEQILDLAETLIQTRGYSAFSYQDIADSLGIRKASIHYHFPSKTDLGIAVVDRYIARFDAALTEIADDQSKSSMTMLDFYVQPYLQFASTPDRVCLSGALAGEMLALPPELRARVDHFFRTHQAWLTKILKRGVARGEFKLAGAGAQGGALRLRGASGRAAGETRPPTTPRS